MADDTRMIAIAIGVASSVQRNYLAGAISGARAFEQWASSQGYETALILDEDSDVTLSVLRQKLEDILRASDKPIHRIIIYFAGHGLIREMEEGLWLLSDWRTELRAVAVEVLKRRLSMYRPRQVCIIADACRSLPANVEQADLNADPVLGAGPYPADMTVAIDKFIAAQDGAEAFMIPGANPEDDRCLFSGVLVEGLWGLPGLQTKPFSKREPDRITSRSLGAYLAAEVPARAKTYGLTLTPMISPTFPEEDDYYFRDDATVARPVFPPWPPQTNTAVGTIKTAIKRLGAYTGITDKLFDHFEYGYKTLADGVDASDGDDGAPSPPPAEPLLDQLRAQTLPDRASAVSSGFGVSDSDTTNLWLGDGVVAQRIGAGWSVSAAGPQKLQAPAPALIEFPDGRFAATLALPNLFASLLRDDYGVTAIVYRDPAAPQDSAAATENALAALENGALRADAATDLAAKLREWKHADPVLGVISAYLYDAIGDIDSIRRMASFYVQNGQAIPYDVALLGGLQGMRTPNGFVVDVPEIKARTPRTAAEKARSWTYCAMSATRGLVGGLWPWMRQGWSLLDDPSDVGSPLIMSGLVELRSGLTRSRFATFEKAAALALAQLCGLTLCDST